MSKREIKYFTFPIIIFRDGNRDIKQAINNGIGYCIYTYSESCKSGSKDQRIKEAEQYYGLSGGSSVYSTGKMLHDSINDKSPKTSISTSIMFDFLNNNKTEFEVITFIAFAAIRSIIQKQAYSKITNEYLIGRMAGNSKAAEPIPDSLFKYNNRYQLDKIKLELQLNWHLKLWGKHTRGYYVSFEKDIQYLVRVAMDKSKKAKIKKLQLEKEAAYQAVYGTTS